MPCSSPPSSRRSGWPAWRTGPRAMPAATLRASRGSCLRASTSRGRSTRGPSCAPRGPRWTSATSSWSRCARASPSTTSASARRGAGSPRSSPSGVSRRGWPMSWGPSRSATSGSTRPQRGAAPPTSSARSLGGSTEQNVRALLAAADGAPRDVRAAALRCVGELIDGTLEDDRSPSWRPSSRATSSSAAWRAHARRSTRATPRPPSGGRARLWRPASSRTAARGRRPRRTRL